MQFATSLALEEFQLTGADIQSGVMEGQDDGGIDGFHIVVNKTAAVLKQLLGCEDRRRLPVRRNKYRST